MKTKSEDELLELVTRHYLDSHDFNGLPVTTEMSADVVANLIGKGLIGLNRGDKHPNSHIKGFALEPAEQQLSMLKTDGLAGCLYPEQSHLARIIDRTRYEGKPFTLRLALGEPQLSFLSFDLTVLESYRNDPRYTFKVDDVCGMISISDKHLDATQTLERDKALLQSFGFAYDDDFNRAVAVYLRYLHDLTPEHQRLWEARLLDGSYRLHPEYYRSSILGKFPETVSIFVAFTEELRQINAMSRLMGKPPLFRHEFIDKRRPREFTFLIRPTLSAFNAFAHLLDKMISDNMNEEWFKGDVPPERDVPRDDGKVVVERKGSIQMLAEWLLRIRFPDPKPRDDMLATFRRIRKLRRHPAHTIDEDEYDQKYFKDQRALIIEGYTAVRTLRQILANHPATNVIAIPDWLYQGRICSY